MACSAADCTCFRTSSILFIIFKTMITKLLFSLLPGTYKKDKQLNDLNSIVYSDVYVFHVDENDKKHSLRASRTESPHP